LTQGALAHMAHVATATIGRLETRGARDSRVFVHVCRALDTTPAAIDAWIAARYIDARLVPLLVWFADLPPSDQDAIGRVVQMLFPQSGG